MSSSIFDESLESKVTLETESTPLPEDLPFNILMIGDWGGSSDFSSKPLSARKFVEIDRDEFDDVMRKITPQVNLKFDGSANNSLRLTFESLDDFHPDSIFQRISLFSDLRSIRQKLKKSDTFDEAAREVRSWYSTPAKELQDDVSTSEPSVSSFESGNLLDQILDNKPIDNLNRQNVSKSPLSEFIGNIIAPHIVKTDFEEQSKLLAIVDEVISDLMRNILHHRDFQQLESAWRGLYFLVKRVETDNKLKIFFAQMTKEELLGNLSAVNSLSDSQFYKWMVEDEISSVQTKHWAVACGNYEFGVNIEDAAALMRIAKIAEAAKCPFISQVGTEIFGVSSFAHSFDNNAWKISQETSAYKLWSALRAIPESGYLAMSLPRFLGRLPYGEQTEPTESFSFEEFKDAPEHAHYLWLNPSFASVYGLAKQFSLNEWDIDQNNAVDLENLPLHIYKSEEETLTKPCAEIYMTENIYNSIVGQGIMALISFKGEDRVRLSALRSISIESSDLKGRW